MFRIVYPLSSTYFLFQLPFLIEETGEIPHLKRERVPDKLFALRLRLDRFVGPELTRDLDEPTKFNFSKTNTSQRVYGPLSAFSDKFSLSCFEKSRLRSA